MNPSMLSPRAALQLSIVRLGAIGAAILVIVIFTVGRSQAAFTATTANTGNSIAAGTVALTDDDSATAMFSISNMKPGVPEAQCLEITYSGSAVPAEIRTYGTTGGSLDAYLDMTIEVGTGGNSADCSGFTPATTPFTNTLANYGATHTDWASGLSLFSAVANPTVRTLRITLELQDDDAAQGLSTTVDFTFESQA